MYQITYTLPTSKQTESHLLKMDKEQQELYDIIQNNFKGVALRKTGENIKTSLDCDGRVFNEALFIAKQHYLPPRSRCTNENLELIPPVC